jgi:hypothetical protein
VSSLVKALPPFSRFNADVHFTGPLFLLFVLLFCCFMSRSRRLRLRRAGADAPGRQVGPMYFPTPAERTNYRQSQPGPGMTETGRGGMGFPVAQPATGPGAPPIQTQTEGDLPSPPPVYQAQGRFQPVC